MSTPAPGPSPWWNPSRHADRRPVLLARARIKAAIRAWFVAQDFIEVETGCLQISPGNETHLHAFATQANGPDLSQQSLYLHTSPEFACKKLLAAGETKIFTFAPVFRNRERGPLHAPEFTMLEWYRTGAPYEQVMADAAEILKLACAQTGARAVSWRGRTCDPHAAPEILTVGEAFSRTTGLDLGVQITNGYNRDVFAEAAGNAGFAIRDGDAWADIFAKVLTAEIEPRLGVGRATLLTEYPAREAALARPKPGNTSVAERFELYCCGVELANGFGELTDPVAQRANLEAQMAERQAIYGERYPIDEDFLAALAHMPPASGCALGFDRLVMLATGATHIDQVIWTPIG